MKLLSFAPYGSVHPEGGLLTLFQSYVAAERGGAHAVTQVLCNGAFSVCGRDREREWRRGIQSCPACTADQIGHSEWAGIRTSDLTRALAAVDIERSRRWVTDIATEKLTEAQYEALPLWPLVQRLFAERAGSSHPGEGNRSHDLMVRQLYLVAVRAYVALRRLLDVERAELLLIAGEDDLLVGAARAAAATLAIPTAVFVWVPSARAVEVRLTGRAEPVRCELMVERVTEMRREIDRWSEPLLELLEELRGALVGGVAPAKQVAIG